MVKPGWPGSILRYRTADQAISAPGSAMKLIKWHLLTRFRDNGAQVAHFRAPYSSFSRRCPQLFSAASSGTAREITGTAGPWTASSWRIGLGNGTALIKDHTRSAGGAHSRTARERERHQTSPAGRSCYGISCRSWSSRNCSPSWRRSAFSPASPPSYTTGSLDGFRRRGGRQPQPGSLPLPADTAGVSPITRGKRDRSPRVSFRFITAGRDRAGQALAVYHPPMASVAASGHGGR